MTARKRSNVNSVKKMPTLTVRFLPSGPVLYQVDDMRTNVIN